MACSSVNLTYIVTYSVTYNVTYSVTYSVTTTRGKKSETDRILN